MLKTYRILLVLCMIVLFGAVSAHSSGRTTSKWSHTAEEIYDEGFMHGLMRNGDGGVRLFNMELIENDSPGAGYSEKGVFTDVIWGKNRARKIFKLADPRAKKAYLIVYISRYRDEGFLAPGRENGGIGKYPLKFTVNNKQAELANWDIPSNSTGFRWVEFPAEWLKKGNNVIDLFCPEAENEEEGWGVFISRAEDYEDGGGDPKDVGKTSFKSFDGGRTWKESPFLPSGNDRAEYSVRLSLDRHIPTGWLESPVIDLWRGNADIPIVPIRIVYKMKLSINADVPEDTQVEYFLRKGREKSPYSDEWSDYRSIGKGSSVEIELDRNGLNRRYIRFKAILSTNNPLKTPVVRSAKVECELYQPVPTPENIYVLKIDNAQIKYSSVPWEWEKWDRPEFQTLKKIENLDEVIGRARTDLGVQVRLMDHTTKRWRNNEPLPEYPGWDALGIINHIYDNGGGGMCIQLNLALAGFCMSYGHQARLVNIVGHEVCEVWNNDHAKWIYLDASTVNHFLGENDSIEPMNMLDLHNLYIDYFFPDRPIDWMNDRVRRRPIRENDPPAFKRSSLTNPDPKLLGGFIHAAFIFMVPRNNFYEKPTPRPLSSGRSAWPWCGYIHWYDERTPPMRQHSWFTDRPRDMWPELNKTFIDATTGYGNDRVFLWFETFTPNFSHFEVNVDDTGWKKAEARFVWILEPGRNRIAVRAVNKFGVKGYPSTMELNHAHFKFGE